MYLLKMLAIQLLIMLLLQKLLKLEKIMPDVIELVTNTVFNTKIGKFEIKIRDVSGPNTNTIFKTKVEEVHKKRSWLC